MIKKLLCIFTHTPLHIGAGASVGAIDQPIVREKATKHPVMPGSGLKGVFADAWGGDLIECEKAKAKNEKKLIRPDTDDSKEITWLFGAEDAHNAAQGSIQFQEARVLAFPVRSAKGSFVWITCPDSLHRAVREGLIASSVLPAFPSTDWDDAAMFAAPGEIALSEGTTHSIVLEDYTHKQQAGDIKSLASALAALHPDPMWKTIARRLVIVSNGMFTFYTTTACEVAQHVRINDATGTAAKGGLFNQENVPSETMFFAPVRFVAGFGRAHGKKTAEHAAEAFAKVAADEKTTIFQFGGDATTGHGFCSVVPRKPVA